MYKNPLKENRSAFKGQKNLCISFARKYMKKVLI